MTHLRELAKPFPIPLRRRNGTVRAHALIDAEDAATVSEHAWYFDGRYPATRIDGVQVRLHRLLLNPPDGMEVDHLNGDKLDNRRANMRMVDHLTNLQNVPARGGSSRHRGVSWDAPRKKWRAQAKLRYAAKFLGRFDTEAEAVAAVQRFWEANSDRALSHAGVTQGEDER